MDENSIQRIMDAVPEKARDAVLNTTYPAMVKDLAKPGEAIQGSLTFHGFTALAEACASMITTGNQLDIVKKMVVYNKPVNINDAAVVYMPEDMMAVFSSLTAEQAHFLHMAVGLAGEATEMLDQIFNHIFHGADLDEANIVEEGGDATFYIQGLAGPIGVCLGELLLSNKAKLIGKRYPNGYSDAAAIERADKPAGE